MWDEAYASVCRHHPGVAAWDRMRRGHFDDVFRAWPVETSAVVPVTDLGQWYRDMTPCWMMAEPPRRRRLVLRVHRWIAERFLEPMARGEEPFVADLEREDALAATLARLVPPCKLHAWRPWILLVLTDLRLALAPRPTRRDETWARRLFLIPYSIPVRRDVTRLEDVG